MRRCCRWLALDGDLLTPSKRRGEHRKLSDCVVRASSSSVPGPWQGLEAPLGGGVPAQTPAVGGWREGTLSTSHLQPEAGPNALNTNLINLHKSVKGVCVCVHVCVCLYANFLLRKRRLREIKALSGVHGNQAPGTSLPGCECLAVLRPQVPRCSQASAEFSPGLHSSR